jgi:subtilisin family serine protease
MSENGFFYQVGEQIVNLQKVNTVKYVSPARDNPVIAVGARLARSSRLSLAANVSANHLVIRGEPDKFAEVAAYPDVYCVRSAFVDLRGHELILTDDVLVAFYDEGDYERKRRLCESLNCVILDDREKVWKIRVRDTHEDAPLRIANILADETDVRFAEPNALLQAKYAALPGDQFFANQWHLRNVGQNGGKIGADVNAAAAWNITLGDPGVRVVVNDSGVDSDHPDLQTQMAAGWDFDNNDNDASPDFAIWQMAHGTACAGVIAARRNAAGVVGIAPNCRITPLRAAGAHPEDVWARMFDWAAQNGEIISCSWSLPPMNILTDAIVRAAQGGRNGRGIPCFFASGNEYSPSISYPASIPETIAVGASTNLDVRAAYSNFGVGLDFVAPSSGGTLKIETTDMHGPAGYNSSGDYCKAADDSGFSGTSSATPLAAGVAALMVSVNPHLTAREVREILRATADKINAAQANYDANGFSLQYGFGRINAGKAVEEAQRLNE